MAAITLRSISREFDGQQVLSGIDLELSPGQIVGLVGANGSGKTTLLKLIDGQLDPDEGTIERARGLRIGYLSQEPRISRDNTLHAEVGEAFAELLELERELHETSQAMATAVEHDRQQDLMKRYDRLHTRFEIEGGYDFVQRMNIVLSGLGFLPADHFLPMHALSGGQKCRAALAKLLLRDHDFLLLDEPTNHLDIDATAWLEQFLEGHQGGAVIVSHDRYLLDRVSARIIELDRGRATSYPGNYTQYVEARNLRRLTQTRQQEKDQTFIAKELAFIRQHLAGQRTKQAQGRRTRLARRHQDGEFTLDLPQQQRSLDLNFAAIDTRRLSQIRVEEVSKCYGEKTLFKQLRFQIHPQERFAITGPNGTGKTTLLRMLMGEVPPDSGHIEFTRPAIPGYFSQETRGLPERSTVLEHFRDQHPEFLEPRARDLLGFFGFRGDDVFKPIGALSGGEQSRLRLMLLILSAPEVLILDEPTNHLDIAAREALEEALLEFPGTLIAVSHDRYFIDRLAQRLLVLRPDDWRVVHGNYSDYVREQRAREEQARREAEQTAAQKRQRHAQPRPTGKKKPLSEYDAMSLEQLEALIMEREQHIALLHERFARPEVYRDPQKLGALRADLEAAQRQLAEAEDHWAEREP